MTRPMALTRGWHFKQGREVTTFPFLALLEAIYMVEVARRPRLERLKQWASACQPRPSFPTEFQPQEWMPQLSTSRAATWTEQTDLSRRPTTTSLGSWDFRFI